MKHVTEVKVKQGKTTKYVYIVDGKLVRTSTRKYAYSTADGSYFSSRLDLLQKNAQFAYEFTSASHRANLTMEQYQKEQEEILARCIKEYNEYNNDEKKNKWVSEMVDILFYFGGNPTEEKIEERRNESINSWEDWLAKAKERMEKQIALICSTEEKEKDLENTREQGKARLKALDIVTYKF